MRELWAQAFGEFEKLSALPTDAADRLLRQLRAEQPALAALVDRILAQPAISLQPIAWADSPADAASAPGARLGAYTLIREIGRGGTGSVWLGERADGIYHGQVAIKLLSAPLLQDVSARQRFAREGELLARLSHPSIARLLDAGTSEEGARYLVLEYIDGLALGEYCKRHAPGIEATIALFCQAVDAVAYSHAQLILHRDIKPGNMLVTAAGELKLLDFGLGKLLHNDDEPLVVAADVTRMLGIGYTPRYASPEQMRGSGMTTASDVYSLGVTLYELLTGVPFEGSDSYTRPSQRLADSPTRSTWSRRVRGDIDAIVAKAVSEAPEERYANAAAFGEDLRRFLNHEPVTAQPDTTLYRAGKFVRRHRLAVGSAALATVLTLVSLAVALWQWHAASVGRAEARYQASAARTMLDVLDAVNEDVPDRASGTTTRAQIDRGLAIVRATPDIDATVRATLLASFAARYSDADEIALGMRTRDEAIALLAPLVAADARAQDLHDAFVCQQLWDRAVGGEKAVTDDLRKLADTVAARAAVDPETAVTCLHAAASVSLSAADLAGSQRYIELALARIEQAAPGEVSAMHAVGIRSAHAGRLANGGDTARAMALYGDILKTLESRGMRQGTKWNYFRETAAWTAMMGGDLQVAQAWARDDYPQLVALKGAAELPTRTDTIAGRYWLWAGDSARASAHFDAALTSAIKKKAAFNTQRTLTMQALVAIYDGDAGRADAALARLHAQPPLAAAAVNHRALLALAEAAFALRMRNDPATALATLRPFLDDDPALRMAQLGPLLIAAEAALRQADAALALDYCRRARRNAEQTAVAVDRSVWVGAALWCEAGALAQQQGDGGEAAQLRARAQRIWAATLPPGHPALAAPGRLLPRVP